MGSQLWSNTFETTQGSNGHYLAVGCRELVAGEDVTEEVGLQVVVILRAELVVEGLS